MVRKMLGICVIAVFTGAYCWAQETTKQETPTPTHEAPKPGAEHEKFKECEGEWEIECNCKVTGKSTATASFKVDFGGFYLIQDVKGTMNGQSWTGRGTCSYCPVKKKFVSTWISSMCPSMAVFEGTYDADGKVLTEVGENAGPDGKMMSAKNVLTKKDKDNMEFTMYKVEDGKDVEMMTLTYKRKS